MKESKGKLLIIADDFTGALDTGVQFAASGAHTKVVIGIPEGISFEDTQVLVIDSETRHMSFQDAYEEVKKIVKSLKTLDVQYIYKKTDSALRGNIGAELQAVIDAADQSKMSFVPAYPQIGRMTRDGIHYIDGVPVADSSFGKEMFNPVKHSSVQEIIKSQSQVTTCIKRKGDLEPQPEGITIYDAQSVEDIEKICAHLLDSGVKLFAGCAGLGTALSGMMGFEAGAKEKVRLDERLLVICGTINPVTISQMDEAEKAGFVRYRLSPERKLDPEGWSQEMTRAFRQEILKLLSENKYVIIDSNDANGNLDTREYAKKLGLDTEEVRRRISGSVGKAFLSIQDDPGVGTLLITGGDVLQECMRQLKVCEMEPLYEIAPGVVLSRFYAGEDVRYVISKSGGFGSAKLFTDIAKMIKEDKR